MGIRFGDRMPMLSTGGMLSGTLQLFRFSCAGPSAWEPAESSVLLGVSGAVPQPQAASHSFDDVTGASAPGRQAGQRRPASQETCLTASVIRGRGMPQDREP